MTQPRLLSPICLRGVTLRNRVVISPMCQFCAIDGMASDWRFAHLPKFPLGGAGLIFTEPTVVEQAARVTHRDGSPIRE
jgi:2,4-dienoyl-CoA reductase-like NADH-dependent reductase (Old Yellow Enzyme family)